MERAGQARGSGHGTTLRDLRSQLHSYSPYTITTILLYSLQRAYTAFIRHYRQQKQFNIYESSRKWDLFIFTIATLFVLQTWSA